MLSIGSDVGRARGLIPLFVKQIVQPQYRFIQPRVKNCRRRPVTTERLAQRRWISQGDRHQPVLGLSAALVQSTIFIALLLDQAQEPHRQRVHDHGQAESLANAKLFGTIDPATFIHNQGL